MDPFEGVAGFEDTFFEYGEVEAGAAAFGEAADELHVTELGPHFETGFARRRHLEECSTGAEEISGFDLILGDASIVRFSPKKPGGNVRPGYSACHAA